MSIMTWNAVTSAVHSSTSFSLILKCGIGSRIGSISSLWLDAFVISA